MLAPKLHEHRYRVAGGHIRATQHYSLPGSNRRPMAHRTIALTTELRELMIRSLITQHCSFNAPASFRSHGNVYIIPGNFAIILLLNSGMAVDTFRWHFEHFNSQLQLHVLKIKRVLKGSILSHGRPNGH